jgi:hypothetical protein
MIAPQNHVCFESGLAACTFGAQGSRLHWHHSLLSLANVRFGGRGVVVLGWRRNGHSRDATVNRIPSPLGGVKTLASEAARPIV